MTRNYFIFNTASSWLKFLFSFIIHITVIVLICVLLSFRAAYSQKTIELKGTVTASTGDNLTIFNFSDTKLNVPQPTPQIVKIDSATNQFEVTIPVNEKYSWIVVQQGRQFTLFVAEVGSKLQTVFNGRNMRQPLTFTGKGKEIAEYVPLYTQEAGFIFEYPRKAQPFLTMPPEVFEKQIDSLLQADLEYIATTSKHLPKDFTEHWQSAISFMNYNVRLNYPQTLKQDPASMSQEVKNVVLNTPKVMNDKYLSMVSYQNYIQSYFPSILAVQGVQNVMIASSPETDPVAHFNHTDSTLALLFDQKHTPKQTGELASALILSAHAKQMPNDALKEYIKRYKQQYPKSVNNKVLDQILYDKTKFDVGSPAMDFEFTTIDGKRTKLSNYKGKVVYLDFWASWCGPCRQQMPIAKEIKKYFEGKNVEFLYVSIDNSDEAWRKGIENMQIEGIHTRTVGWGGEIAVLYNVSSVPAYFLIDKKGNFAVDKAPRPSQKETLIKEIERLLEE